MSRLVLLLVCLALAAADPGCACPESGTTAPCSAFAAALIAFVLVLVSGPPTIRWLLRQKIGDSPEFYNERLNTINRGKAGVPTMGGLFVVGSVLFFKTFDAYYTLAVSMFVVGSALMLLGSIGSGLRRMWERRADAASSGD